MPFLAGSYLKKESTDWSKKYADSTDTGLKLVDPFTGALVPKQSMDASVFKPEVNSVFKISPKKEALSKKPRLNKPLVNSQLLSALVKVGFRFIYALYSILQFFLYSLLRLRLVL